MADRTPKPQSGTRIDYKDGRIIVPDDPIVPFIEGDGTGPDIWRATRHVLDGALKKVYRGKKSIAWYEVFAGEKAQSKLSEFLPQQTIEQLAYYRVSIKGPL